MTRALVEERLQPKAATSPGYAALGVLGVAAIARGGSVSHGALLYRWKKKEVRIFEMRNHEKLNDDLAPAGFVWIEPSIPRERMTLVMHKARLVHRKHADNAIPYGFGYRASSFDQNGGLRLGDAEIGLTCATIVAAIFESEGLQLLDPTQWPAPDECDKAVRRRYLDHLRQANSAHAKLLEADIDAPRISPEEVVTAAAIHPELGTFANLQDGAAVVRQRIGT